MSRPFLVLRFCSWAGPGRLERGALFVLFVLFMRSEAKVCRVCFSFPSRFSFSRVFVSASLRRLIILLLFLFFFVFFLSVIIRSDGRGAGSCCTTTESSPIPSTST